MLLSFHTDINMKFVYTDIIAIICFGHAFSFDSGEVDLEGSKNKDINEVNQNLLVEKSIWRVYL